jgi:uncharacterized protein (TIGR03435 family)
MSESADSKIGIHWRQLVGFQTLWPKIADVRCLPAYKFRIADNTPETFVSVQQRRYAVAMNYVPRLASVTRSDFVACFVLATAMAAIGQENISANPQGPSPQSAPYVPTLVYDVISVRQCPPGPQAIGFENPAHSARLRAKCVWAEQLVGLANGVMADRVLGGPDWVRTVSSNEVRFDVQATSDAATDDMLAKLSNHEAALEKEHMLQQLLVDRFRLKAHIENREKPAFTLLVARNGPRMQTGDPPPPSPPGEHSPGPKLIENKVDPRGVEIDGHGATMDRLAKVLELWLRKSVIDQTRLTGTFNFDLKFHGTLSDMAPDDGSMWPPVETAIRTFGLELKSANVPLRVVVIDSIEMPSPN